MKPILSATLLSVLSAGATAAEVTGGDLSYGHFIDSDKPIKCFYGYLAEKTGDHASAIKILEDCIRRWNSVYSMILLAQIYETGVAVERNLEYATALIKRGAETNDPAGYSSLAKYHYGIALIEGRGTQENKPEGIVWLKKARAEGLSAAGEYLTQNRLEQ